MTPLREYTPEQEARIDALIAKVEWLRRERLNPPTGEMFLRKRQAE